MDAGKLMLRGMCNMTGTLISGLPYLRQRIEDALTTPVGSQVLLRARGSTLLPLVDMPMNASNVASAMAAIAGTINSPLSGLPDFSLSRIRLLSSATPGQLGYALSGKWAGSEVEINV